MAVEDEVLLEFQGEDSSLSKTAQSVLNDINQLDISIQNLISTFNSFSQASGSAESSLSTFTKVSGNISEVNSHIDEMTKNFSDSVGAINETATSMEQLSNASQPIQEVTSSMEGLKKSAEQKTQAIAQLEEEIDRTSKANDKWKNSMKPIVAGISTLYGTLKRFTLQAAEAYRTQTRFNAVFDRQSGELREAQQWVNDYADALLLDNMEVENAISRFRIFTNTMGVNNEKSKEMSMNMTQLAYDLAAVSGNDVSQTVNQLTSALGGQTKALKQYGIAIDKNTLQQTLNEHGINRKISSLTAAELAETRYVQIMERSAGMQGYYAKTLLSPANALNIIKTQFSMLAREIGNVFIPILMALVPIVMAVTKALRSLAQAIAGFFGISINFDDYSGGFSMMAGGIGDVGDAADGASKKMKNMLRDFDNLHVIDFDDMTGSGSGAGGGVGGGGGGDDLFDPMKYADWESAVDKLKEKMRDWLPLIIAIGAALAAWKIAQLIDGFKKFLALLDAHPFIMLALSIVSLVAGFKLFSSGIDDIIQGNISLNSIAKVVMGTLLTFAGVLGILRAASKWNIMGLGGLGLAELASKAFGLTLIITGLTISFKGLAEIMNRGRDASALWLVVLGGINLAMLGLVIVGAPLIAIIVGIGAGVFWLAGLCVELYSRIRNLIDPTYEVTEAFDWMSDRVKGLGDKVKEVTGSITSDTNIMASGVTEDLNTIDQNTLFTTENIDSYLTDDMKETLGISGEDWENYKNLLAGTQDSLALNTKNNLDDMQKNINNTDTTFGDVSENIGKSLNDIDKNMDTTSKNMIDDMKQASGKYDEYSKDMKNSLENINTADVRAPQFSWAENAAHYISSALSAVLGAMGLPTLLPKMVIDWVSVKKFATGGFPNKGDLFIANEREPELVGSMGNRSAVANNSQIIEGIAQGSYQAFVRAMRDTQSDTGGDTYVYVGDTQLTDVVTKRRKTQDRRFGR